jgi:hypothetical protein
VEASRRRLAWRVKKGKQIIIRSANDLRWGNMGSYPALAYF